MSGNSYENPPSVDADPAPYTAVHSSQLKSLPRSSTDQPNTEKLKTSEFDLSPTVFAEAMVYPTPEEFATLRKVPGKIHLNAYLIAFVEFAERFSYYGATVVFTNYMFVNILAPTLVVFLPPRRKGIWPITYLRICSPPPLPGFVRFKSNQPSFYVAFTVPKTKEPRKQECIHRPAECH